MPVAPTSPSRSPSSSSGCRQLVEALDRPQAGRPSRGRLRRTGSPRMLRIGASRGPDPVGRVGRLALPRACSSPIAPSSGPSRDPRQVAGALSDAVESAVRGAPDTVRLALGRPAVGRAPAGRGHARDRQDAARQVARRGDRRPVRPGAVHARPAARRRHRHLGVRPGHRRVGVPARPDLRQRGARRRGQPGVAPHAGRAARADGGAPGHRRRRRRTRCPSRSSSSRPRTRSAAPGRSRCPRASSTGSRSCARSACPGRAAEREILDGEGGVDALAAIDPVTTPDELRDDDRRRAATCTARTRCSTTCSTSPTRRACIPDVVLGASPRAASACSTPRGRTRP